MKRHILLSLLAFLCLPALALSLDEIKNSGQYYWGEGVHAEPAQADRIALEMLSTQISVSINSHTSLVNKSASVRKSSAKEQKDEKSEYMSVINTYSQATLDNTGTLSFQEGKNTRIIRYIEKQNVYKVFDGRRRQIVGLLETAEQQLPLGKIDVALKNLYWAYALLRSMPGTSTEEWRGRMLSQYIPEAIDKVLDDVKISIIKHEGNDFDLGFTYQGKPVTSIDYYCIEGGYNGPLYNAGEGRGEVSVLGAANIDKLEIEIEYKYIDQAGDAEMQAVLQGVSKYNTKRATRFLAVDGSDIAVNKTTPAPNRANDSSSSSSPASGEAPKTALDASTADINTVVVKPLDKANAEQYHMTATRLLNAIAAKESASKVAQYFAPEAITKYNAIIRSGNARIVSADRLQFTTNARGEAVCRGAVMAFKYRSGKYRSMTRDVVFTFNSEGKVSNLTLGLGESPRNNILDDEAITHAARNAILEFVENYQTAFAMKDSVYLRRIFDDNAIIITGTVIKDACAQEDYLYRNDQKIIYNRQTKNQYLERLRRTFNQREYVNLRFNNIKIVRIDDQAEVYGMQLEQDYFSPTYCDHGYLYLQFQILDPSNPVIHVRTWQPGSVDIKKLFNHTDFKVYK